MQIHFIHRCSKALSFIEDDNVASINWEEIESLPCLFQNTKILDRDPALLEVPWESLMGRIIRKNKLAFRIVERPNDDKILTDVASIKSVVNGIIDSDLNAQLTAQGILLRVMGSSVYPHDENRDSVLTHN